MSGDIVLFDVVGVTLERRVGQAPTISDVELERLLGYERERTVRELIERRLVDFPRVLKLRTSRSKENAGNLPDVYTVDEYSLSIVDALRLVERSEAPNRSEVLAKLSDVVEALIERGLAPSPMTPESIALLATKVASETTFAMLRTFGSKRVRKAALNGQAALLRLPPPPAPDDPWKPLVEEALARLSDDVEEITVMQAYIATFGANQLKKAGRAAQTRIGIILRALGWGPPKRGHTVNGLRPRIYSRPSRPS